MDKCDGKIIFSKNQSKCDKQKQTTPVNGTSLLLFRVANVLTNERDGLNKIKKLLEVLR